MADGTVTHDRLGVLQRHLVPSRRMRVCDVGANPLSAPPYAGLLAAGLCEVFGFEPQREAYEKLCKEASVAETYFPAAIGAPGTRSLHLHPSPGFTSLYPMDRRSLRQIGKTRWLRPRATEVVPLETIGLDAVDGLPDIDLLKMDLQGAEGEVVQTGEARLAQAVAVITEVRFHRIYKGEPVFGDLDAILRKAGFRLHKFLFHKSIMMPHPYEDKVRRKAMTSQLLDGDAVYLRDVTGPDAMSDDQLKFLAFAAEAMFDSPDLALMCLGELEARGIVNDSAAAEYIAGLSARQQVAKER